MWEMGGGRGGGEGGKRCSGVCVPVKRKDCIVL